MNTFRRQTKLGLVILLTALLAWNCSSKKSDDSDEFADDDWAEESAATADSGTDEVPEEGGEESPETADQTSGESESTADSTETANTESSTPSEEAGPEESAWAGDPEPAVAGSSETPPAPAEPAAEQNIGFNEPPTEPEPTNPEPAQQEVAGAEPPAAEEQQPRDPAFDNPPEVSSSKPIWKNKWVLVLGLIVIGGAGYGFFLSRKGKSA